MISLQHKASISHQRFAGDIVLLATKAEGLNKRLQELDSAGQKIGLRINLKKNKDNV